MLEMSANGLEIDCGAFIACGQINLSRQSIWINKLATEKGNFYSRKKTNKLDLSNIYSRKNKQLDPRIFIAGENKYIISFENL